MTHRICLITGVMASGKSTVAQLIAERLPRAVHLRGDAFRKMIVSGRVDMSAEAGPEAFAQLELRYRITARAARMYWEAGFDVIVQDNYYGEMLPRMVGLMEGLPVDVAVLCPSPEAVARREAARGKTGYGGYDVRPLWEGFMKQTPRIGFWIDSTDLTAEQTADRIIRALFKKED